MFRIFRTGDGPVIDMGNGRGTQVRLVDATLGTTAVDVHVNHLVPGGPRGRFHRHTATDNV